MAEFQVCYNEINMLCIFQNKLFEYAMHKKQTAKSRKRDKILRVKVRKLQKVRLKYLMSQSHGSNSMQLGM